MYLKEFKPFLQEAFGQLLEQFQEDDEYGFNNFINDDITRIGFSTNLTPDVIKQGVQKRVHFIITHHDAWDFLYGMKQECMTLLEQKHISHFYTHLPLDYAPFGTCNSLLNEIGISKIIQQTHYSDKEYIGIGEFEEALRYDELVDRMSNLLDEDVKAWKNSEQLIKRVGALTRAGHSTDLIKDAYDAKCDVYITGEKSLYTVQYAKYIGLNLIVGSHTFTERFGVRSLAKKVGEHIKEVEIIELEEEHIE